MIPSPFPASSVLEALQAPTKIRNFGFIPKAQLMAAPKRVQDWFKMVDGSIYNAKRLNQKVTPAHKPATTDVTTFNRNVRRVQRHARKLTRRGISVDNPADFARLFPGHMQATLKQMQAMKRRS